MINQSKLPWVGTTIFTVMSKRAAEHGAVNLSQGFPDYDVDERLIALVTEAMQAGQNQYAPMPGVPELNAAIATKIQHDYGWQPNPETEITVTSGATQGLYSVIGAMVGTGDEVIVIEPSYDSYIPAIASYGGVARTVPLRPPHFKVDWQEVASQINSRTRLIMINTPHNPCGVVLEDEDMQQLEALVLQHGLYVVSDEVYEHMIYDGKTHCSVLRYPGLYSRSFALFSFGKSLHVTGWKTGYVIAPPELTTEYRKIHQFTVFSGNRPMQVAVARYLERFADFPSLSTFFQTKRDLFLQKMANLPLRFLPCHGSYFILADYSEVTNEHDRDFAIRLTKEGGVATIPLSPFYREGHDGKLLRFCFAKKEETLIEAAERLKKYFV